VEYEKKRAETSEDHVKDGWNRTDCSSGHFHLPKNILLINHCKKVFLLPA
jgi:hypothetical protein